MDALASSEASSDAGASRCVVDSTGVTCQSQSLPLSDGMSQRTVTYETPLGTAPTAGWPTVVYFQGSFVPFDLEEVFGQLDVFLGRLHGSVILSYRE